MSDSIERKEGHYDLETNPDYAGFKSVDVTEFNGPVPVKAEVTKADGTVEEIDASTSFYTLEDADGNKLNINAASAGHVDKLHIRGEDPGGQFDCASFDELAADIASNLPEGIASAPGVSAFSVDMGKSMGGEGLASMKELLEEDVISQKDIDTAEQARETVADLNKSDDQEAKEAFVKEFASKNPECKIQFQVVRDTVVVPVVDIPNRPTTELFMVWGPGKGGQKTLWTAAPGRNMPRHPNPSQFKRDGGTDTDAFRESEKAWFDNVMLVNDVPKPEEISKKAEETGKEALDAIEKLPLDASFETLAKRIPEVQAMVGFDQKNDYHTLTVDKHTIKAVETIEADPFLANHPKRDLIILAMKLHDVGKPHPDGHAPKKNDSEKLGFIGHELVSRRIVEKILPEYFELSDEDIDFVAKIVGLHASALQVMSNFGNNPEPVGKKLKSYAKFVDNVAEIPGEMDLADKMKIVFAINRADKSGGYNEDSDMQDPKVQEVKAREENDTVALAELEKALPVLFEAIAARKAGDMQAGLKKLGAGEYECVKSEAKSEKKKVEIPAELKPLGRVLKAKLQGVAEVYPKLQKLSGNENALKGLVNGLLKGKLQLDEEQVQAVLDTLK